MLQIFARRAFCKKQPLPLSSASETRTPFSNMRNPATQLRFLSCNAFRLFGAMMALAVLFTLGCGAPSSAVGPTTTSGSTPSGTVPHFEHVVLIVEENSGFTDVIDGSAMPYLKSLAAQYGLATQYYANTHPSVGNYFMLTAGDIVTTDDGFTGEVKVDNVVRQLLAAGKTWKSYAESRGDATLYVKRHDPLSYFSDVVENSAQMQNLVLFSQFSTDLANNSLPNFSFIVPNLVDDGHDAPLQVADNWLKLNIAPLISNPTFQKDGLLIIVFDEAAGTDTTHDGGHVAAVIISAKAKKGFQSTTFYQHESTLRLILEALGVSHFPGASSSAPDMGEFF
jgi:phospholipase C